MPASGCTLWPPNHKLVQVATVTAADALSGLAAGSFKLTGVSNEPSDPDDPQIVITPNRSGGFIVQLQADRLGTGNGRVYTLTATAADLAGNPATATATCTVPHDQGSAPTQPTTWTQRFPAPSPTPRDEHSMAYDAARGQVVLFGGFAPNFFNGFWNDTWVWDGTNWTQKSPANRPLLRAGQAMAYDAARGQVVLFGGGGNLCGGDCFGFLGDTWVWPQP